MNDDAEKIKRREAILKTNKNIRAIFERASELEVPHWYLGAGCIAQTVWNSLHGFDPDYGIKDYDLVYFDDADLSYDAEDKYIQKGKKMFADIGREVEIRNQARVHLWYEQHFGYAIVPYHSVEEGIKTFPTTATAIGVRHSANGFEVYAPFGLDDMFAMIVRPNKRQITEAIYRAKADFWKKIWPQLIIISWNE